MSARLAEQAEETEQEKARRLVLEERARIARDLHDVVAHHMSLVVVQAQTAPYRIHDLSDAARAELSSIGETARSALAETRALLGVLRREEPDDDTVRAPQPGLDELPVLLDAVRRAGVVLLDEINIGTGGLGAGTSLAAYRIVAEALANATRHSPGSEVRLVLRRAPGVVYLRVENPAPRPPGPAGHGIIGMRERVRAGRGWRADRRAHRRRPVRRRCAATDPGAAPVSSAAGTGRAIRVIVVDDQAMVRQGFAALLDAQPGIEVIGDAANGRDAVTVARATAPDVVLMDIRMPVMDGIEATRLIVGAAGGAPKVLMLTTFDLDDHVYAALRAGASGFLLKDARAEDLVHAVRVVAAGDGLLAPSVTRRLIEEFTLRPAAVAARPDRLHALTPRETDVLTLVAGGLSNGEIAERLVVAEQTVKTHVGRILTKLDLRDRTQAVVLAYETGLVLARGHIAR